MFLFIIVTLVSAKIEEEKNLTFGLDVLGNTQVQFFKKFESYFPELKEKGLQMQLAYHLIPCYTCQSRHNYTKVENNCYGGGRYCCKMYFYVEYSEVVSGQVILDEILRQQCFFDKQPKLFMNYSIYFAEECTQRPATILECSRRYFDKFNVSSIEINTCIEESFIDEGDVQEKKLKKNRILEEHKLREYNYTQFTLYINQVKAQEEGIIMTLCNSMTFNPPSFCNSKLDRIKNGNLLERVFVVILILLILMIIAQSGWKLLNKFPSLLMQKNKIAIPKEREKVILEDDL